MEGTGGGKGVATGIAMDNKKDGLFLFLFNKIKIEKRKKETITIIPLDYKSIFLFFLNISMDFL